jgi:hypothetical protein
MQRNTTVQEEQERREVQRFGKACHEALDACLRNVESARVTFTGQGVEVGAISLRIVKTYDGENRPVRLVSASATLKLRLNASAAIENK